MENNRPLGWTTLEEAKLLVEAGLDPNTADMYYYYDTIEIEGTVKYINGPNLVTSPYSKGVTTAHMVCPSPLLDVSNKVCPCWSLGALIGLMPRTIHKNDEIFHLFISYDNTNKWSAVYGSKAFRRRIHCSVFSNQIELLLNVISWLLGNGYIKKSK